MAAPRDSHRGQAALAPKAAFRLGVRAERRLRGNAPHLSPKDRIRSAESCSLAAEGGESRLPPATSPTRNPDSGVEDRRAPVLVWLDGERTEWSTRAIPTTPSRGSEGEGARFAQRTCSPWPRACSMPASRKAPSGTRYMKARHTVGRSTRQGRGMDIPWVGRWFLTRCDRLG